MCMKHVLSDDVLINEIISTYAHWQCYWYAFKTPDYCVNYITLYFEHCRVYYGVCTAIGCMHTRGIHTYDATVFVFIHVVYTHMILLYLKVEMIIEMKYRMYSKEWQSIIHHNKWATMCLLHNGMINVWT